MYFSMNKLRYTVCNVHFSRFMKIFNGNSSLLKKVKSSGRRGGSVGIKSISLELAGGFTFVFYGGPLRCFFIVFEQYGVINEQQEHRFCKVKLQTIRTAHIANLPLLLQPANLYHSSHNGPKIQQKSPCCY